MFQGFSPETTDFLWGIRFNNDRTWFEEHKAEYKAVLEAPMRELCRELYEGLSAGNEALGLMGKVSRIYRDARRLFGRGPYKDHLWLSVGHPHEDWSGQPAFWFEIQPDSYSYGLGYWSAQAVTMAKLRARMEHDPKTMEKLVRAFNRQHTFTLRGEDFKRRRQAPSTLLDPWYNKKSGFSMGCTREGHDALLYSPALVEEVLTGWKSLLPLYKYLSTVGGDPDPRDVQ